MHLCFTALYPDDRVAGAVGGAPIGLARFRGFEESRVSTGPPIAATSGASGPSVSGRALSTQHRDCFL